MNKVKKKNTDDNNFAFLVVFGILLFFPPFFGGLFLDKYWLPFQLLTGVAALLFMIQKGKGEANGKVVLSVMDVPIAILVITYIASLFAAVNVQGAVSEFFKMATYLIIYLMVPYFVDSRKDLITILRTLYWSGVGVVLLSIGTAFGTFEMYAVFVNERIFSTLQYPNTFAAFITALFIVGLHLALRKQEKYWQVIYSMTNFIMLVGFFGAKSRGGLLTFLPIVLLFILGLRHKQMFSALIPLYQIVLSYLFINYYFPPAFKGNMLLQWFVFLAAIAVSVIPTLIIINEQKLTVVKENKRLMGMLATGLLLLGLVMGIITLFNTNQEQGLQKVSVRFANIEFSSREVQERFIFYEDALKVVKDYPLIGAGGKAWKALYRQYQGYNYASNEVHNHYLQVWVENGTIGLIAFLSIWVAAIWMAIKMVRKALDEQDKHMVWAIISACLALGIHALIDFDLSVPAVSLLLWSLFACLRALQKDILHHDESGWVKIPLVKKASNWVIVTLLGIHVVVSMVFVSSWNYGNRGNTYLANSSFILAKNELETAVKINPLASNYLSSLAQTLMFNNVNEKENLAKADEYIDRALRLEPYNPDYRMIKGNILLLMDKVDEAVLEFEQSVKLSPYQQRYADRLGEVYFLAGQYFYNKKDKTKAVKYLKLASEYPSLVSGQIENIAPRYKKIQSSELELKLSDKIITAGKLAADLMQKLGQ